MTRAWIVPPPDDGWALFLDVDGTLIDIAPAPDAVRVEPGLPALLARLAERFGGSLALVSGRSLSALDGFFSPHRFAAAGIHGVEWRDASGAVRYTGLDPADLDAARAELSRFVERHPGLLLEDKGRSLAVHFRHAQQLASQVDMVVRTVAARIPAPTQVQPGHCVVELKSAAANKRTAIERFMRTAPFAGRTPVFAGDDVTDRDGFAYVESVGGHAIFVGPEPEAGRGWLPDAAAVRSWLRSLAA